MAHYPEVVSRVQFLVPTSDGTQLPSTQFQGVQPPLLASTAHTHTQAHTCTCKKLKKKPQL